MKVLFTIIISLLIFPVTAQVITVSEALPFRKDESYDLLGKYKDNILLHRSKLKDHKVICFDENLQVRWEKKLEFFGNRPKPLEVLARKDDFGLLYLSKEDRQVYLRLDLYDENAEFKDSLVLIDFGRVLYSPDLEFEFSENKEVILSYRFEQKIGLQASAYNIKLENPLWTKLFSFKPSDFDEDLYQIIINDKGEAFFVFLRNNEKKKKEEHFFEILQTGKDREYVFRIPMKEHLTFDVKFSYDELNDQLVAGGLFSKSNLNKVDGYFFLNISPSSPKVYKLVFNEFEKDFVNNFLDSEAVKKGEILNAEVKEIVLRRDGGILLITELVREFERYSTNAGRPYNYGHLNIIDYYFDDIFVISLHPDGRKHWETILYKKQYSQDDDAIYSSFFLAKTPLNLRFLFNDEIKQENSVSEYIVNGAGETYRNAVMNTKDQKIRLRFPDAKQVEADEVIVPSDRQGRLKLVRIRY